MSPKTEFAILRVTQAALTKVHRHCRNNTATIRPTRDEAVVSVETPGQGKGTPVEKLADIQSSGG